MTPEIPATPGGDAADLVAATNVNSPPNSPVPVNDDEPLSQNRDFKVVLGGQGVSSFGDAISNTALPLLVLALTGSGTAMGIVGALSTLPDLLVGLLAGAYADRWDRRRMMFIADLGRAALTALVPISIVLGWPTMVVVLLVTFPINVLRVLWLAAWTACVPGLVGRGQVARANAIFEAFFNVGWIAGPGLAGVLSAQIGPGPTIALDAASFLFSSGAILLVRRSLRPEHREDRPHILTDVREGIRYVVTHPTLRAVIALWSASSVITAALGTALTYHMIRERGAGKEVVGLILSAFSVGSLAGSLIASRLGVTRVGPVMLTGTALTGLSLLAIIIEPPVPFVLFFALLAGIVQAAVVISYLTFRTALSPDHMLGRIGSTARTISVGLMPIGAMIGGAMVDLISGRATLAGMGLLLLLLAAVLALMPTVRSAVVPRRGAIS